MNMRLLLLSLLLLLFIYLFIIIIIIIPEEPPRISAYTLCFYRSKNH